MERRVEAERSAASAASADVSGSAVADISKHSAAPDVESGGGDGAGGSASASAPAADAAERRGGDDGSSASEAIPSGNAEDSAARAQAPAQTSGRRTNDPRRLAVTAGSYITPEILSMFGCGPCLSRSFLASVVRKFAYRHLWDTFVAAPV